MSHNPKIGPGKKMEVAVGLEPTKAQEHDGDSNPKMVRLGGNETRPKMFSTHNLTTQYV